MDSRLKADLDRYLTTDPRDDKEPVKYCCSCGEGIYEGEDYYDVCSEVWCENCMAENKKVAEADEPDYYED